MRFSRQEHWRGSSCPSEHIFPSQELNPNLLHCRLILYQLSQVGSPSKYICKAESLCWTPETQHGKSNICEWKKKIKRIHQYVDQLAQKTNWKMQKDSQTYSQWKFHREQGMKGKGWFKSWSVAMGEDSEYKGDYTVGNVPWVWVIRAIYWTQVLWSDTGKRNNLRWLQGYVD